METYEVYVQVDKAVIEYFEKCASNPDYDDNDKKLYAEALQQFTEWNNHTVKLRTLNEYSNLLDKISSYCDGYCSIHDEGNYIRVTG